MPFDPISYSLAKRALLRPIIPPPGVWEVLADITLTVDSDFVDFTGLDLNMDGAYAIFVNVKNPTATSGEIRLYVEADYVDTNHWLQILDAGGTTVYLERPNRPSIGTIDAGSSMNAHCFVFRDPDGYVKWHSVITRHRGSSVGIQHHYCSSAVTYTNVTQIRLAASVAGGLGAGSRLMLARVKKP